jgi:hypothetical protein
MRALMLLLCMLTTVGCAETRPKCYIAPQTAVVHGADEVVFNVYWINDTNATVRLPAITTYDLFCYTLPPEVVGSGGETGNLRFPERLITPHSTLHDQFTSHVLRGLKPSTSAAIDGTFYNGRQSFYTNTVVLRKAP